MEIRKINSECSNRYNTFSFKKIIRNDIPSEVLKNRKYLLVVSGPSGVGKDTVMNKIIDKFNKVITHTTRAKREGEIDGKSYFFTTVEKFVEGIKNNEFVEYVTGFSGKYYGTKKATVKNALNGEKPGLAIVDVDGAYSIRKNLKDDPEINVVSVFFEPPSMDVLKARLSGRGTESPEAVKERLNKAMYEIGRKNEYDAVIAFDNPEEGIKDMKELLHL